MQYFGTSMAMGEICGVSAQTISNWTNKDPRNMLRHLPEIHAATRIPMDYIVHVVQNREMEMQQERE